MKLVHHSYAYYMMMCNNITYSSLKQTIILISDSRHSRVKSENHHFYQVVKSGAFACEIKLRLTLWTPAERELHELDGPDKKKKCLHWMDKTMN